MRAAPRRPEGPRAGETFSTWGTALDTKESVARDDDASEAALPEARADLAAAFRWAARLGMHEGVANHFSLAVSADGARFLVNPAGRHFSRVRASELLLLDANDEGTTQHPDTLNPTAWCIHAAMHRRLPNARCVLHLHPKYATVIAALEDCTIPPIDQNTMRFHGRVAVDDAYGGMALGEEAERLPEVLGDRSVLLMANHGVMVVGPSVAEAFDELYYLERACETVVTAYATGKPLRLAPPDVAARTARQWRDYPGNPAGLHFRELRRILDEEEPDYRD